MEDDEFFLTIVATFGGAIQKKYYISYYNTGAMLNLDI
jgi:hypothetical protein